MHPALPLLLLLAALPATSIKENVPIVLLQDAADVPQVFAMETIEQDRLRIKLGNESTCCHKQMRTWRPSLDHVPMNEYTSQTFPRACQFQVGGRPPVDAHDWREIKPHTLGEGCWRDVRRFRIEHATGFIRLTLNSEASPPQSPGRSAIFRVTLVGSNNETRLLDVCSAGNYRYYATYNLDARDFLHARTVFRLRIRQLYDDYFVSDPEATDDHMITPTMTEWAGSDCVGHSDFEIAAPRPLPLPNAAQQANRRELPLCDYRNGYIEGRWIGNTWAPYRCRLRFDNAAAAVRSERTSTAAFTKAVGQCFDSKRICFVGDSHTRKTSTVLLHTQLKVDVAGDAAPTLLDRLDVPQRRERNPPCPSCQHVGTIPQPEQDVLLFLEEAQGLSHGEMLENTLWGDITTARGAMLAKATKMQALAEYFKQPDRKAKVVYFENKFGHHPDWGDACESSGHTNGRECNISRILLEENCTDVVIGFGHWGVSNYNEIAKYKERRYPTGLGEYSARVDRLLRMWNASAVQPNLHWVNVVSHPIQPAMSGPNCRAKHDCEGPNSGKSRPSKVRETHSTRFYSAIAGVWCVLLC
jgi:hypothetical protein